MASASPTVFHMLERLVGKRVLAVINRDFGYEGHLAVVSHEPPGIWLTESEAVILRSTVVSPIPQVVNRESRDGRVPVQGSQTLHPSDQRHPPCSALPSSRKFPSSQD